MSSLVFASASGCDGSASPCIFWAMVVSSRPAKPWVDIIQRANSRTAGVEPLDAASVPRSLSLRLPLADSVMNVWSAPLRP